jgi:HK97 family phage major capsid protein
MSEFIKTQEEIRANLTMQIREVLDGAESESRGIDSAEVAKIDRIEADIRKADEALAIAKRQADRMSEAAEASRSFSPVETAEGRTTGDILRSIANGEVRGHEFEQRNTLVPSANTVPKSFYDQVFDKARLVGPMLDTSEIFNTTTGEDLTLPTMTAYSVATLAAAGAAIDESEPTYASITLGAYKYGLLIPVASELVSDAGFNLEAHLADQAGNGIGTAVNTALTTGTGTSQPSGIVTGASAGITGSAAVAGAFTADNLIDLAYTGVDGLVRRLPGTAYMASGAAIGAMRKLKDGNDQYLYQVGVGQPDQFAGFDVIENPNIAAPAALAISVLFGHLPSYKVRMAGGLNVASSADYAFNTDTVTYRFTMRVDGALTHTSHVRKFTGGAAS